MKRILIFALAAILAGPALAQLPANPSKITVETGNGTTVTKTVRPNDLTRNVHVTHNPSDTLTVIDVPHMTSGMRVDKSTLAAFPPPFNTIRVKDTTEEAKPAAFGGNFRVECFDIKLVEDDPIVYPAQPGKSHDHTVLGNADFNAFQTADSMLAASGSSCKGGTVNMSNYWVPTMIDIRTNKPILLSRNIVYYKTSFKHPVDPSNPKYNETFIHQLPKGLKMISGDPTATAPYSKPSAYRWNCRVNGVNNFTQFISTDQTKCLPGGELSAEIFFPQCWDGVNLDSPNHKSHMAEDIQVKDPTAPSGYYKTCPPTHPKAIASISFSFGYTITDTRYMRLVSDVDLSKPAGITYHGDVFAAWNDKYMKMITDYCLRGARECIAHLIGPDPDTGKLQAIY